MTTFGDFGRAVQDGTLAEALEQLPGQMELRGALVSAGTPQNADTNNRDPNEPRPDGTRLLLCDETPIGQGVLGP